MAKKTIAASAEKLGVNDVAADDESVKFISDYPEKSFMMPVIGEDGKQTYHTDANGNGKLADWKEYKFTKISGHKNKDGKVDPTTAFSFFIVSKKHHGADYERILAKLTKDAQNPANRIFTEDDHFKKRNPEAFRIASERQALESEIEAKNKRIVELESRLGFKKTN